MAEEEVMDSVSVISEEKSNNLYPMVFGVSCALFALKLLSEPEMVDEIWFETRNRMLQGSAHLLGLLVWRVQREKADDRKDELVSKLEKAEKEIEELKRRRSEDAKANEKVVGIFASQEQNWFSDRKKLRRQIGALLNELRVLEMKKDEAIHELNGKLQENEDVLRSKERALEEEEQKRKELEEKLKKAEAISEGLRETAKREAQEHSNDLWKHKTAFIELVSNQRQLESEMGRALRQVEAVKEELDSVFEQKEESVLLTQKLSMELIKLRKELEQKDKILSAMLRKSKSDTLERQMLLKEIKLSKAKRKQAEVETEKLRAVSESRRERHSLRNMLSRHASSKLEVFQDKRETSNSSFQQPADFVMEYEQSEKRKEPEDRYNFEGSDNKMMFAADVKQLEGWVKSEAEKYAALIERRHHLELDAFAEQLRLKDEKLEDLRWRSLSMELESKRVQSHVEGLDHDLSHLTQENMKLEALLMDRESELNSLKEKFVMLMDSPNFIKTCDLGLKHDTPWSKVRIIKRNPGEKEREMSNNSSLEVFEPEGTRKESKNPSENQSKDIIVFEEVKNLEEEKGEIDQNLCKKNFSKWKMDLHALGVCYKIKRLKQQLLMLERLRGNQENCEDGKNDDDKTQFGGKEFHVLMSLLNKQVTRYQSLQGKTDDLCKRMHENDLDVSHGGSRIARTKEETKLLEHFLEETFQLQRYIVATGQKMMEIQSKIASGFEGCLGELDGPASFDMKRFTDSIRTLFREVQRGLEVRIARSIGDLEGTMACDGIIYPSK